MSMGLNIGAAMKGGSRGLRMIEEREAAEQANEMRGLQLDEARAAAERRPILEQRQDEEYEFQKKERDRKAAGMMAMRDFMVNDDLSSAVNYMNEYSPEGTTFYANANPDGTYDVIREYEGKTEKKTISKDQIGETLAVMAHADPTALYESRRKERMGAEAKKGEQQFEIAKMREEYRLKGELEKIKLGGKTKKGSKEDRQVSKDLWGMAAKGRGLDMDTLDFNTRTGMLAAYDAKLSYDIYDQGADLNDAHLRAKTIVNKLDTQINAKLDEQGLQGPERDQLYEQYMDRAITAAGAKLRKAGGQKKQTKEPKGLAEPEAKPKAKVKEGTQTETVDALGAKYGISRRKGESDDDYELRIRSRLEADKADQREKEKPVKPVKEGLKKTGTETGTLGLTKEKVTPRTKVAKAMTQINKIDEYKSMLPDFGKTSKRGKNPKRMEFMRRADKLADDFEAGKQLSEEELRDALHARISNRRKIKIVDKLDEITGEKTTSPRGLNFAST